MGHCLHLWLSPVGEAGVSIATSFWPEEPELRGN